MCSSNLSYAIAEMSYLQTTKKRVTMHYKSKFLNIIISVALVGCASPMQQADNAANIQKLNTAVDVKVAVPFDEAQAKSAIGLGSSTIKGVLYHKVSSNGKYAGADAALTLNPAKYISGVDIFLYPVTAHLQELMRLENENRSRSMPWSNDKQLKRFIPDNRMYKYALITKTDEHGRYFFNQLNPGRYLVIAADQDVTSTGTETVRDGTSVVSDGFYTAEVAHYRDQNYRVRTPVHYEEYVEIKPGQKEMVLESRMRYRQ
jgi:hypothetical protein